MLCKLFWPLSCCSLLGGRSAPKNKFTLSKLASDHRAKTLRIAYLYANRLTTVPFAELLAEVAGLLEEVLEVAGVLAVAVLAVESASPDA
jgi:hypothetical protein